MTVCEKTYPSNQIYTNCELHKAEHDFYYIRIMQIIQGTNIHQSYFATLEDQVGADNPERLMDAFVEKLDLVKIGICSTRATKQQIKKSNYGGAPRFNN